MCPHPIRDRDLRCIPFAWKVNIPAWKSTTESLLKLTVEGSWCSNGGSQRFTVKHSTFKQIKYIKESKGPTLHDTTCLANIKNKINGSLCSYTYSRTTASGVKHSVPNLVAKRVLCSQLFHCRPNGRVAIFWSHLLNLTWNGSSIKTRALFKNLLSRLTVYLQHSV